MDGGVDHDEDPGATWTRAATPPPAAEAQREALRKAIAFKKYEFDCHGVEMNQRYTLGRGGDRRPARTGLRPGSRTALPADDLARRAPAACLGLRRDGRAGTRRSISAGKGRFTHPHRHRRRGLGRGRADGRHGTRHRHRGHRDRPAPRLSRTTPATGRARARSRDSGCVLVRPDQHVAWRSEAMAGDPAGRAAPRPASHSRHGEAP